MARGVVVDTVSVRGRVTGGSSARCRACRIGALRQCGRGQRDARCRDGGNQCKPSFVDHCLSPDIKTKNFHWHMSGPHFRDYHLLLDEQGDQIFAMTDPLAERVRKLGGTTLRSIGQIARMQRVSDNDAEYVTAQDMLAELRDDNRQLVAAMREAHAVCDEHNDVASASLIEVWIDETERRTWFLFEASPYISHYLCMIGQICEETCLLFCRRGRPWRLETRECLNNTWLRKSRSGLGGPGDDAAWVTRCGGVCQAGEARALAAAARRLAAQPQAWAAGHADAIATLMRRTLTHTRAPILSSLRRMVPQVALANGV
jgi:starvation-inducible DNA-binding protein